MGKKKVEVTKEDVKKDGTFNMGTVVEPIQYEELEIPQEVYRPKAPIVRTFSSSKERELVSCLKNRKVIIKHLPKETGLVTNPNHVLYGGMAENAVKYYTVPMLQSGKLVNVLTDEEKDYLEYIMGLEYNTLSIYRKDNNYWENLQVRLTKQDNILDLSSPDDYIKYKVLLANKDEIAPSMDAAQNRPKATYKFVIIEEGEEISQAKNEMTMTMRAFIKFGEFQKDFYALKTIYELIDGRPVAANTSLDFLLTSVGKIVKSNPSLFLTVCEDKFLDAKILIKRAIEAGIIANRGNFLYLTSNNTPLCDNNEEPTLSIAAKFISLPKNQELKFSIEGKLKALENE